MSERAQGEPRRLERGDRAARGSVRHDFNSVNSGLVFGLGKRRWKFFPLDLDRGAYELWLNARYDASTSTLFIKRLVARK